jgi:hypothetical protein
MTGLPSLRSGGGADMLWYLAVGHTCDTLAHTVTNKGASRDDWANTHRVTEPCATPKLNVASNGTNISTSTSRSTSSACRSVQGAFSSASRPSSTPARLVGCTACTLYWDDQGQWRRRRVRRGRGRRGKVERDRGGGGQLHKEHHRTRRG